MSKLKQLWRERWCLLTNGHIYADIDIQTHFDQVERTFTFRNRCRKCGKVYVSKLPAECIIPPAVRNSFYVDVEDAEDGK